MGMRAETWVLVLILLGSIGLVHHPGFTAFAIDSQVHLAVVSEDSSLPALVDPGFTPGTSFNMSIQATNLPLIVDQANGGLSGFDISINYNSSIIKPSRASFDSPFCPSSDGCILDLPQNDTLLVANSLDANNGLARVAMVVIGPTHRATMPALQGEPAILFRIQFDVVGKGLTSVNIDSTSSRLLGFSGGCGNLVVYSVTNGSFDNRPPFRVFATPLSPTINPGGIANMQVNVSLVNSAGNGNVQLLLSGINPIPAGTAPEFTYVFSPMSGTLNGAAGANSFIAGLQITSSSQTPTSSYLLTIVGVIPSPAPNPFQYNYNFTLNVVSGYGPASIRGPANNQVTPPSLATPLVSTSSSINSALASFTSTSNPSLGYLVSFAATAVWCSLPSYSLRWDFGDGSTGTGNPASHTYSSSGTFTVTLTVTYNGTDYTSSQDITIPAAPSHSANLDVYSALAIGLTGIVLVLLVLTVIVRSRKRKTR